MGERAMTSAMIRTLDALSERGDMGLLSHAIAERVYERGAPARWVTGHLRALQRRGLAERYALNAERWSITKAGRAAHRAATRAPSAPDVETVAQALFEADEDLNDQSAAELRSKGEYVAADILDGHGRAQWDDPRNEPIHDAFRYRARKVLALLSPSNTTEREG